jgi:patatin-like phospholipase/acyl hydrolase
MPLERRLVLLSIGQLHSLAIKYSCDLTSNADGGGIRGLSSIMVVEDIMKNINQHRHEINDLKPYQVFDLIAGTGTGG